MAGFIQECFPSWQNILYLKINRVTGAQTLVTNLSGTSQLDELLFIPARNELSGLLNNTGLYSFNLSTKASSVLPITTQQKIYYSDLTSN